MSKIPDKGVKEAAESTKVEIKEVIKEVERTITVEEVAEVAHEVNRAYCQALDDNSQPPWAEAPEWQRNTILNGVAFHIGYPAAGPEASHNNWLAEKEAAGWVYGPVKNPEKKEHPCIMPFDLLPTEQRAKDFIFRAVVHALLKGK